VYCVSKSLKNHASNRRNRKKKSLIYRANRNLLSKMFLNENNIGEMKKNLNELEQWYEGELIKLFIEYLSAIAR
jgi:hypothetical protein